MKSSKSIARIAAVLACFLLFAAASFAATNPLNGPFGLALDASGNLWVANLAANNILEFNPSYELVSTGTITAGINAPIGVAFDPNGNLWVANSRVSNGGNGDVTMYTKGVQNTAATITNEVVSPTAIAIDGLGNVWVANDGTTLNVYALPTPGALPSFLVRSKDKSSFPVHAVTVSSEALAVGGDQNGTSVAAPQWFITSGTPSGFVLPLKDTNAALATAANGDIYVANYNGTVNVFNPATNVESQFLQLNFVPSGIVVDSVRGRVYVSDGDPGTSIFVYNMSGVLLHTIE